MTNLRPSKKYETKSLMTLPEVYSTTLSLWQWVMMQDPGSETNQNGVNT